MPIIQNSNDPIWSNLGIILPEKFGVMDFGVKSPAPNPVGEYGPRLLPEYQMLPKLGSVLCAKNDYFFNRKEHRIPKKFSLSALSFAIVVGAGERMTDSGEFEYAVSLIWIPTGRVTRMSSRALRLGLGPIPTRLKRETVLRREKHSSRDRTRVTTTKKISYVGPPCFCFAGLPESFVRETRSLLCDTLYSNFGIRNANLLRSPRDEETPVIPPTVSGSAGGASPRSLQEFEEMAGGTEPRTGRSGLSQNIAQASATASAEARIRFAENARNYAVQSAVATYTFEPFISTGTVPSPAVAPIREFSAVTIPAFDDSDEENSDD